MEVNAYVVYTEFCGGSESLDCVPTPSSPRHAAECAEYNPAASLLLLRQYSLHPGTNSADAFHLAPGVAL